VHDERRQVVYTARMWTCRCYEKGTRVVNVAEISPKFEVCLLASGAARSTCSECSRLRGLHKSNLQPTRNSPISFITDVSYLLWLVILRDWEALHGTSLLFEFYSAQWLGKRDRD
jgi:hypothetical protein